jgi:cysteine/O-acetylserine efflux protein
MTTIAFAPLIAYVLIASFTPGPATLSTSSLAMRYGFARTGRYQAGLALGVLTLMLASGLLSASVLAALPALEPVLRWVGAGYIVYLAYSLLRAGYGFAEKELPPLGGRHGLLLNVTNPKLWVYALTVFATFLAPISGNVAAVAGAALALAAVSAASTVTWALFGAGIKARLRNPRAARWINVALALLLVYAAIELTGVLPGVG